jgi:hypothetical protein
LLFNILFNFHINESKQAIIKIIVPLKITCFI